MGQKFSQLISFRFLLFGRRAGLMSEGVLFFSSSLFIQSLPFVFSCTNVSDIYCSVHTLSEGKNTKTHHTRTHTNTHTRKKPDTIAGNSCATQRVQRHRPSGRRKGATKIVDRRRQKNIRHSQGEKRIISIIRSQLLLETIFFFQRRENDPHHKRYPPQNKEPGSRF